MYYLLKDSLCIIYKSRVFAITTGFAQKPRSVKNNINYTNLIELN